MEMFVLGVVEVKKGCKRCNHFNIFNSYNLCKPFQLFLTGLFQAVRLCFSLVFKKSF